MGDAELPEEDGLYSSQGELMDWRGMQREVQQEEVKIFSDLDLLVFS